MAKSFMRKCHPEIPALTSVVLQSRDSSYVATGSNVNPRLMLLVALENRLTARTALLDSSPSDHHSGRSHQMGASRAGLSWTSEAHPKPHRIFGFILRKSGKFLIESIYFYKLLYILL